MVPVYVSFRFPYLYKVMFQSRVMDRGGLTDHPAIVAFGKVTAARFGNFVKRAPEFWRHPFDPLALFHVDREVVRDRYPVCVRFEHPEISERGSIALFGGCRAFPSVPKLCFHFVSILTRCL